MGIVSFHSIKFTENVIVGFGNRAGFSVNPCPRIPGLFLGPLAHRQKRSFPGTAALHSLTFLATTSRREPAIGPLVVFEGAFETGQSPLRIGMGGQYA